MSYLPVSPPAFLFFVIAFSLISSVKGQWTAVEHRSLEEVHPDYVPQLYDLWELDMQDIRYTLQFQDDEYVRLHIPSASGTLEIFEVSPSHVFHPELTAKYPSIRSYRGVSLTHPHTTIHMGYDDMRFHAMILRDEAEAEFVDYVEGSEQLYTVYRKSDYGLKDRHQFECLVEDDGEAIHDHGDERHGDCQLRKYRLALACTGEYATFHGGTVESVLAEYNVAMTRVNGIYERDAGITMELISNTDELIFLDAATDPYTNNDGGTMLGENQSTVNSIIGTANYDIGHVFSTGGGGIASLRSPCGNGKARGVTGLGSPINDPFYVDYVAHEMGHQFGGNHTQNNDCNRSSANAVEPGSASTIMGYAGICSPNVQNNSDDYFHGNSLIEIANFVTGQGNCAEIIETNNTPPTVSTLYTDVTIPASTPFFLEAIGEDAEGDPLTYCWEQMDPEVGTMPPQSTNAQGPMFRSLLPTTDPRRFFPPRSGENTWEVLASVTREYNFMCTVRDNNTTVGCTDEVNVRIQVDGDSGPFMVTYPNGGETWNASNLETITWNVNGTDVPPVSAGKVDIYLSLDGGETFDFVLAEDVVNDGSHEILVPDSQTDEARVVIIGDGNVFYDMSDSDFSIASEFAVSLTPFSQVACGEDQLVYTASIESGPSFQDVLTLSVTDLPPGVMATFSDNDVMTPAVVDITLTGLEDVAAGNYVSQLVVEGTNTTVIEIFNINIQNSNLDQTQLTSPEDGFTDVSTTVDFFWEPQEGASLYQFQISTNPAFATGSVSSGTSTSSTISRSGLEMGTVYYWRVRARSICSTGEYSQTYAFRTIDDGCLVTTSMDTPVEIPEQANVVVSSVISIDEPFDFSTSTVSIDIEHSWPGDIIVTLESPDGQEFVLMDRPGVPNSNYGCEEDDILVSFSNDALGTAQMLEATCDNNSSPAITGEFMPVTPFMLMDISMTEGDWILSVEDVFQQDGGQINGWSIGRCEQLIFGEVVTSGTKVLNVFNGDMGIINRAIYDVDTDMDYDIIITALPSEGVLQMDAVDLAVGDIINLEDLESNLITYTHSGNDAMTDVIFIDVILEDGSWLRNDMIQINILENTFQVIGNVLQPVSCFGGSDGSIMASAVEGEEPYMYSLDNNNFQSESTFTGLPAGDYIVYVVDAEGTQVESDPINVSQPDAISLSTSMSGYDVTIDAQGGNGGYMYSLDGVNFSTEPTFMMLDNGDYVVTVVDAKDCMASVSFSVDIPELLADADIADQTCDNIVDGMITILASGGIPPYTYSLDGLTFEDDGMYDGLAAGDYTISVLDSGGKLATADVMISAPDPISYTYQIDGSVIEILATGGSGNYIYTLDDGPAQSSNEFDIDLSETYSLTIQDDAGCTYTFDLVISQITNVSIGGAQFVCFGEMTGSILITSIDGGVPPYQYALDDGPYQDLSAFVELGAGVYTLLVRDDNGFVYMTEITISENPAIDISTETSTDTLYVEVAGGTPPYLYSLDGGVNSEDPFFTDIADGEYTVVVTDVNGCTEELVINYVDVLDAELDNIILYPNPASQWITIDLGDIVNSVKHIELLSVDGREVKLAPVLDNTGYRVYIGDQPSGVYLVHISTNKGSVYKKLVKE